MVEAREMSIDGRLLVVSDDPSLVVAGLRDRCADIVVVDDIAEQQNGAVTAILLSGQVSAENVSSAVEIVTGSDRVRLYLDLGTTGTGVGDAAGLGVESVGWLGDLPVAVLSTRGERDSARLDRQWSELVAGMHLVERNESDAVVTLTSQVADLRRGVALKKERNAELRQRLKTLQARLAQQKQARVRAERRAADLQRSRAVRYARKARVVIRRVGGRPAVAAAALVGLFVVLGLVAWLAMLGPTGAAVLAVLAVLAAGVALGLVVLLLRRQAGIVRQEAIATRRLIRKLDAARRSHDGDVRKGLEQIADTTVESQSTLRQIAALQTRTASAVSTWERGIEAETQRRTISTANHLAQIQSAVHLFSLIPVEGRVPAMGGWAASPDLVEFVIDELRTRRPRVVVECGSGVSTLWFAMAIRHFGLTCKVVALEHHERFAEETRALLRRHGVEDLAEVRLAPLAQVSVDGYSGRWYDPAALESLDGIGLLLVDGPPAATGVHARFPAVPLLFDKFADTASIVLDDMIREDEQQIAVMWTELLPGFVREDIRLEKRATVFRRG